MKFITTDCVKRQIWRTFFTIECCLVDSNNEIGAEVQKEQTIYYNFENQPDVH